MKWLLSWELEDEDENRIKKEDWADSWEEVVGHFVSWIAKASDVVKGEVVCYWGDKPYGDGKPCLYFNVYAEETDDDDE